MTKGSALDGVGERATIGVVSRQDLERLDVGRRVAATGDQANAKGSAGVGEANPGEVIVAVLHHDLAEPI